MTTGETARRPVRLRRRRTRGARLPEGARCVTRPGPFGNPFPVARPGDPAAHAEAVARFRHWIGEPEQAALRDRVRSELRGRDLACYCAEGLPCHADVLLELANEG
jgi:hypothetical protein